MLAQELLQASGYGVLAAQLRISSLVLTSSAAPQARFVLAMATHHDWGLALQPSHLRLRLIEHIRLADHASILTPTPSITSQSSSDLETESTGSFFPERSTTLGSLIGIRSRVPADELRDGDDQQAATVEISRSKGQGRHCCWCAAFLSCMSSDACQERISPSLAHLLELERRAAISQRQQMGDEQSHETIDSVFTRNTLFDDDRILPPQPSGAPLRLILEQSTPNSSYLSADWTATIPDFNTRNTNLSHEEHDGANSGRFLAIWPSICGRLSTSMAR